MMHFSFVSALVITLASAAPLVHRAAVNSEGQVSLDVDRVTRNVGFARTSNNNLWSSTGATEHKTPTRGVYVQFGSGACRGTSVDDKSASWYTSPNGEGFTGYFNFAGDINDCCSECDATTACVAVEFTSVDAQRRRCELWTRSPQSTREDSRAMCMKREKLVLANGSDTLPMLTNAEPSPHRATPLPTLSPTQSIFSQSPSQSSTSMPTAATEKPATVNAVFNREEEEEERNLRSSPDGEQRDLSWWVIRIVVVVVAVAICAYLIWRISFRWTRSRDSHEEGCDPPLQVLGNELLQGADVSQGSLPDASRAALDGSQGSLVADASSSSRVRRWSPEGRASREGTSDAA